MTREDRELFERAAAAEGTSLTTFANRALRAVALRVLADRAATTLTREQADAWDALDHRPARDLPGLRELLAKPSPFRPRWDTPFSPRCPCVRHN